MASSSSSSPQHPQGIIGIFWDIENCSVPHGKQASKVANKIRAMPFHSGKSEMEFLVVCDVTKEAAEVIDDLNMAQVNVQHVAAAKKKNAADEKLRQAMRRFVDTHTTLHGGGGGRDATLVLISGDVDFLSDLSDFKHRKGVYVVLLHNRNTSEALLASAHEAMDFHSILTDVPAKPLPLMPFQFTELVVSNIPSSQEMSKADVERKLEEMTKAYHGKVKYISDRDGTAVLKFESADKANRALKNVQGCMVGKRKVLLDFNKRFNFVSARQSSVSPRRRPVAKVAAVTAMDLGCLRPVGWTPSWTPSWTPVNPAGRTCLSDGASAAQNEVQPGRPGQGASPAFNPSSVAKLKIVTDVVESSRRVRQRSESSTADASSEDRESSPGPVATGARRKCRVRVRGRGNRRSGQSSSRTRTSSSVESAGIAEIFDGISIDDEQPFDYRRNEEEDGICQPVMMSIKDIDQMPGPAAVETTLKSLFAEYNIEHSYFLLKASHGGYECLLEVPDLSTGQTLIDSLDGLPYGNKCIRISFQNCEQAKQARIISLLAPPGQDVTVAAFHDMYVDTFGEEITVPEIERCRQVRVVPLRDSIDGSIGSYYIRLRPKSAAVPVIAERRTSRTVAICKTSPSLPGLCSPLCPLHDKRKASETDYILPSVIVALSNMKQRLSRALESHPYGIPHESLLHCLGAAIPEKSDEWIKVVPSGKGIPLEQLLEACGTAETVIENNGLALVRPRRRQYMEMMKRIVGQKTVAIREIEGRLFSLLESAPSYQLRLSHELDQRYAAQFGESFNEVARQFGGVEMLLQKMPDSFIIIGRNSKALVTISPKYQRTLFMLAVRKILSNLDAADKFLSVSDSETFHRLYEQLFTKPFNILNFGVCFLIELFEIAARTEQNFLSFEGDTVRLSKSLTLFVRNAQDVLKDKEGFACTVSGFDQAYIRKFGEYSVPRMSFKTIQGLFNEFPNEFSIKDRDRREPILSLSEKRKLELLQQNITLLVRRSSAGAISLEQVELDYYSAFGSDLRANLASLTSPQSTSELVSRFPPDSGIAVRQGFVVLSTGSFLSSFVRRSMALLFQHPPLYRMRADTLFVEVFRKVYGAAAFVDVEYLFSKGLPFLERISSPSDLALAPHAVTVCRLTMLTAGPRGPMTHDQIFEAYYDAYGEQLQLHGFSSLWELCKSVPELLTVASGGTVGLGDGGRFFSVLVCPHIGAAVAAATALATTHVSSSDRSGSEDGLGNKTKRKSRLAATFRLHERD